MNVMLIHNFVIQAIFLYRIVIFASILMSWVPAMRENAIGQLIDKLARPYLDFFRKFIPPLGMIDFSPIVALIALSFISAGFSNLFFMIMFKFF